MCLNKHILFHTCTIKQTRKQQINKHKCFLQFLKVFFRMSNKQIYNYQNKLVSYIFISVSVCVHFYEHEVKMSSKDQVFASYPSPHRCGRYTCVCARTRLHGFACVNTHRTTFPEFSSKNQYSVSEAPNTGIATCHCMSSRRQQQQEMHTLNQSHWGCSLFLTFVCVVIFYVQLYAQSRVQLYTRFSPISLVSKG